MLKIFYNIIGRKLGEREWTRYGVVGLIGATIDISLLNILVQFTNLNLYHSVVVAFLTSVFVSYFLHSNWTFKVGKHPMRLIIYALSALTGLIITFTIMYLLIEGLGWWYNYAKLLSILITVTWNYTMAKTLIFKFK